MRRRCVRALLAGVLLFATTGSSPRGEGDSNAVLTPERTLRIEFITTPPFIESNPNVLTAFLGYVNIVAPYATISGSLYNGGTLLGTATSTVGAGYTGTYSFHPVPVTWKTASSPWNPFSWAGPGNAPAAVDFTSIHDGTIVGRIDIVIDAGRIDMDLEDVSLWTTFATYSNGGSSIPPHPIVTSVRIVPELPGDPPPPPPPPPVPPPPVDLDDDDDLTVSPADLKASCEEGEGNAVVLDHSVKISSGTAQVDAGCTLIVGANVLVEVDGASLSFDGPLTIQSSQRAEVKLKNSLLTAPTVNVNLPAKGGMVGLTDSTLRADGGDLVIALGEESKLEVTGAFIQGHDALSAGATLHIRGGKKFLGQVTHAQVSARLDVRLDMTGAEATLKTDGAVLISAEGSVTVAGASTKTLVEMKKTDVLFAGTATIRAGGTDGTVKLNLLWFGPSSGLPAAGAVTLEAAAGTASNGTLEVSETAVRETGSLVVRASKGGSKGLLKFEKNFVNAAGDVLLESGLEGKTEEKDNTITSGTKIRIATGASGSCSSDSNSLNAPVVLICQ